MSTETTLQSPVTQTALSVAQLCARNQISRVTFYELRKQGKGPRIMRVGRRVLISVAAEADWHQALETESAGAL
jgi:predicted DNA-binding transcriptional regulator AlpA